MLLGQFCVSKNLLMHIREDTDFPWQKPRQLPSVEANLEGWTSVTIPTHQNKLFTHVTYVDDLTSVILKVVGK